ncbi:MAG: DctP family TRAP transporter solute-binding subunit [Sedimentibacter sp.]|uniref:TRAP transporter substrate-binding protein n=1 Tax=Sedimentibacter sp. TaxID=1960295 RepID=UPI0031595173
MIKKFTKTIVIVLILSMLLTGCGGGLEYNNSSSPKPAQNVQGSSASNTGASNEKPSGTNSVGLEKNVYEIPQYTPKEGVKIIRAAVSLNSADYGITPAGVLFKTLVDGIEEKSGGKILLQMYPADQLASSTDDKIGGLSSGAFELSEISAGGWGDYTSAFAALNVPFLYKNIEVAHEVIDGPFGEAMFKKLTEDCNVIPISVMELGMRHMTNSVKEINAPEDLKGIKIRVQSDPIQIAAFEALGGSIVSVPFAELFTALQQKLCEAQENPIHNIVSKKFYEIQPYLTLSEHGLTESLVIVSEKYWDTLSDEEKGWFQEIGREATEASRKACAEQTDLLVQQLRDYGITVTELSIEEKQAFMDKMSPVYDKAKEAMGAEAWDNLTKAIADAETKLGL